MLYRVLPLVLLIFPTAYAADTADGSITTEEQRLNGYGWTLFNNLFNSGDADMYSPLAHSLDRQIDLTALDHWKTVESGGGKRAIWQDPERGLVSAIASYLHYDTEQLYRFGAEGQWYYGALTASGRAGYLTGTGHSGSLYSYGETETQPFAGVDVRWYATENLSFQVGGEQIDDATLGLVRMEYQPSFDNSLDGLSFFARAASGDEENEYVLGGFRYTFGDSDSLILRDRGNPNAAAADSLSPYFKSLYNGRH